MAHILIVDDDPGVGHMISRIARKEGHKAVAAGSLAEGLDRLRAESFDCVFLDVYLPDGNGLERIADITSLPSPPEIVIITGHGDPDGAELAITSGAWNYIEKTATLEQYALALDQVVKYRNRRVEQKALELQRDDLVGGSPAMARVLAAVAQAATSKANVLLLGETGTGKELVARAIHANSARASGRFVIVDCASLPKNLVESILFGHVRGAFTGANAPVEGLVKLADGGTLFLDEVGELPPSMQKTFLRVLQERRFRPIGSKTEETSDFRLIAATNRDLTAMCAEGSFRLDLLFRLRTLEIAIPPLRERVADLDALALFHTARLCDANGMPVKGISPDVLTAVRLHDWPGNIRELVNTIERMCIAAADSPMLYPEHLPVELRVRVARQSLRLPETAQEDLATEEMVPSWAGAVDGAFPTFKSHRRAVLAQADKAYLLRLLERSGSSIKRACEIAGLSRTRLYYLMQEHGVTRRLD
jgi:two-component system NtrC family response regulator